MLWHSNSQSGRRSQSFVPMVWIRHYPQPRIWPGRLRILSLEYKREITPTFSIHSHFSKFSNKALLDLQPVAHMSRGEPELYLTMAKSKIEDKAEIAVNHTLKNSSPGLHEVFFFIFGIFVPLGPTGLGYCGRMCLPYLNSSTQST